MVDELRADYDSAWKEALTVYFEPFMAFCFADARSDINWESSLQFPIVKLQGLSSSYPRGKYQSLCHHYRRTPANSSKAQQFTTALPI